MLGLEYPSDSVISISYFPICFLKIGLRTTEVPSIEEKEGPLLILIETGSFSSSIISGSLYSLIMLSSTFLIFRFKFKNRRGISHDHIELEGQCEAGVGQQTFHAKHSYLISWFSRIDLKS